VGAGTLELSGTQDNVFRGETRVLQGTLELNKTPGKNAIGGSLVVGDDLEATGTKILRLLADNQIPDVDYFGVSLLGLTVGSTGRVEFNQFSDKVGNVTMNLGATKSSAIFMTTGTFTLGGASLTLNAFQGSSGVTESAVISGGKFNLGTFFSGAGGGLTKTITVNDTQLNNIATDLEISSVIEGGNDTSLTITGFGTLKLSGTNTYSGPTILTSANAAGNGIIEIGNDSAFGTGLVSIQSGNGSAVRTFKAVGALQTIANAIEFNTATGFSTIGTGNLTFTGPVTLAATPVIQVMEPSQTVTFSGVIGESIFGSLGLTKGGRGTLVLTNSNTYSGATTVNQDGGTLVLSGNGSIVNSSGITVGVGGILHLDNNSGGNLSSRLNDQANFVLNGKLIFTGASNANSSESIGFLMPGANLATAIELRNTSGGTFQSLLTADSMAIGTDRTVDFIGTGVGVSADGPNRFSVLNNPGALTNAILPMGRVYGPSGAVDFATYGSSVEGIAIMALPAAAYVTDLSLAGPSSNVRLSADAVLTNSRTVNAILFEPNVDLTGPGTTLTVGSGAFLFTDGGSIAVDNLIAGGGMVTTMAGTSTISSVIVSGAVQKGGRGTLVLSGNNQTAGAINVNEGILEITHSNALGSPAGTTTVRQGATLQINGSLDLGAEPLGITGVGIQSERPGHWARRLHLRHWRSAGDQRDFDRGRGGHPGRRRGGPHGDAGWIERDRQPDLDCLTRKPAPSSR